MVAKEQDFEMFVGETKKVEITIKDDAGAAIDVTGATVDWYLKESADSAAALLHKATPSEVEILDADGGLVRINIVPEDTEDVAPGKYFHGAQVTLAGEVAVVTIGHMTLLPEVAGVTS